MLNRGKAAYLKKLYPYAWAQVHWMAFRNKLLKSTRHERFSRVLATMPREDPATVLKPHCDGIYPVRRDNNTFVKVVATRGYYDGVKKLSHEVDSDVFFGIDAIGPNSKSFIISRTTFRDVNTEYPKLEDVDLTEVLNDFEKARKASV